MDKLFDIPILMLVFNRPNETKKVFTAVRAIKPSKLYVAADGARAHKINDPQLCAETRAIFDSIDWPCEVKTLYRENNLGCGPAVSSAITWFFEQEEMGIILEDDCLPHPDFFSFCETLLHYYKNDEQVMQICGSNFQQGIKRGEASYYFSMFSYIWGWATWRRAWEKYDFELKNIKSYKELNLENYTNHKGLIKYWQNTFMFSKKRAFNTWDYQWGLTILKSHGVCIVPNANLVSNIGNTQDSTHSSENDTSWTVNQQLNSLPFITFNSKIEIDKNADTFFYEKALKPNNSIFNKLKKGLDYIKYRLSW
ncbi:MAG: hypothetical protein MUC81_09520 [Bacteroidia bacterium]|jgi:hypothetical protein|nr:hypothetical protein [Bacteroidia bacterium]